MRIVLRNIKTGLYLKEDEQWTPELPLARCFRHSAEAMDAARQTRHPALEVLLSFEEPPREVVLPLP
jgi:hypothetical protein